MKLAGEQPSLNRKAVQRKAAGCLLELTITYIAAFYKIRHITFRKHLEDFSSEEKLYHFCSL